MSTKPIFSFQALLLSMVLILFAPIATSEWLGPISNLLYTTTMLASLYLVSHRSRELIIGIVLFIPTVATKWMLTPTAPADVELLMYCTFQIVFLAYVMRIVGSYLMSVKSVDAEIFYASIVLYLMFGLAISLLYTGLLVIDPNTFGGDISLDLSNPNTVTQSLHELIYFSFVTQTTLGYGDFSPINPAGRSIAIFQAILGQLYIAVIVARLVGIHIATATIQRDN